MGWSRRGTKTGKRKKIVLIAQDLRDAGVLSIPIICVKPVPPVLGKFFSSIAAEIAVPVRD
jgi:hypothetical protein